MDFDTLQKIERNDIKKHSYYINDVDRFFRFMDDFNAVGVHWNQPTTISASYFIRLLREGSSARARRFGPGFNQELDEMSPLDNNLLDHAALWKLKDGNVICTAFPYGTHDEIVDKFMAMKKKYSYPDSLKLQFLDEKYRFRNNGDWMILISFD